MKAHLLLDHELITLAGIIRWSPTPIERGEEEETKSACVCWSVHRVALPPVIF